MHAMKGLDELRYQRSIDRIERWATGDQYVVKVGAGVLTQNVADGGLEPPPDAVALDRPSHLLADGKAEPRRLLRAAAPLRLQDERGRCPACTAAHAQEVRPPLEGLQPATGAHIPLGPGHVPPTEASLRRTGACGPWRADAPGPDGLRRSPCACGTRGGACERACSADRCASHLVSVSALILEKGSDPSRLRAQLHAGGGGEGSDPSQSHLRWCSPAEELAGIAGAYRVRPTSSQSGGRPDGAAARNQFCSRRVTCA